MYTEERQLLSEKYGGVPGLEFEEDRRRLRKGEPLAYLIGHQPFLGLTIHLDSRPLIPRPETEWWTEKLLTGLPLHLREKPIQFLDLCAGSGAIGLAALRYLQNAHVYFGDIDSTHEKTIRKNIRENSLDGSRSSLRTGDLFFPFENDTFEIIAVNPPYVPEGRALPTSVTEYEPARALYAGPDGLSFIRRIAHSLPVHLARDGAAWIECDSTHASAARDLFRETPLSANVMHDQYGQPRIIVVSWKS